MSVDRFVITLVNAKTGGQEERHWHKEEVIKSVPWLKRMNARGYDVRVRPDGEHGLALLGGLNKADVRLLHERGFAPAAVVETAKGLYEAWVKLSQKPLTEPVRNQAAQGLVRGLGVYSVAKAVSFVEGRLAGFTNQHEQRTGGTHPFVLLAEAEGRLAPAAAYLTQFTQEKVRAQEPLRHSEYRVRPRGRGR